MYNATDGIGKFWLWMLPQGYRAPLTSDDIWSLGSGDRTEVLEGQLDRCVYVG